MMRMTTGQPWTKKMSRWTMPENRRRGSGHLAVLPGWRVSNRRTFEHLAKNYKDLHTR